MLIIQIDAIDLKPPQTSFARFLHVIGLSVDSDKLLLLRIAQDSELGRDDYFLAMGLQHAADQFLVRMRAVNVRRVEESNAEIERAMQRRDRLFFIAGAVKIGHAHATEADC